MALLAGLYVGAAKLGIELDVAHGVITPVWIPSGLSLAALLLFGYSMWPGVALGAFIANATSELSVDLAAGIAFGNTLEAVAGTFLLRRAGFDRTLRRARDVLAFVLLGAFAATALAATNGVAVLWSGGIVPDSAVDAEWVLWWFGDAIGMLLVAPALLAWARQCRERPSLNWLEGLVLAAGLAGVSSLVFLGGSWRYPYLLVPLLVWATLRFKDLGAGTAILIVGVIGTVGTIGGAVPIGGATPTQSVQILQALIAIVGVSMFMIAATMQELQDAQVDERRVTEQLRELDQIKNTFLSAVSHDLRSPLTTMAALSNVVKERVDSLSREELVDALGRISDSAVRANRVLTNLLDVDRISRGAVEAARTEVDLGDLATRVALALAPEGRHIELPSQRINAWVDEGLTERILENLLLNAIRHTPDDAQIWIHFSRQGGDMVVSVEDDGPGVPDHLKMTIFDAFQRGETRVSGTGVGLYLVAQFAALHGGKAWVEDRPDGGAAFRVVFPQSRTDVPGTTA
ncbi:MAG: MASE1 domain-containing protein [Actinomycetota bacterium]|nr:MASE1 domain-containing protein [Actinomycetota bacterium]